MSDMKQAEVKTPNRDIITELLRAHVDLKAELVFSRRAKACRLHMTSNFEYDVVEDYKLE